MRPFELDRRLASLASLGDPLRRDLYHLDKLVRAGLLDTPAGGARPRPGRCCVALVS